MIYVLKYLLSLLGLTFCLGIAKGQVRFKIDISKEIYRTEHFHLGGHHYIAGEIGQLENRHFEVFEIGKGGSAIPRYRGESGYYLQRIAGDGEDHVFIASLKMDNSVLNITAMNSEMQVQWTYEWEANRILIYQLVAEKSGGCSTYLSIDYQMWMVCIDKNGNLARKYQHAALPAARDFLCQLDASLDGVMGVMPIASELTGQVNHCTPDYDLMGFQLSDDKPMDTIFLCDLDPYSNVVRYDVTKSPVGGRSFWIRSQFEVDIVKTRTQWCDDTLGQGKLIPDLEPGNHALRHGNRMAYRPNGFELEVWEGGRIAHTMALDALGPPQAFTIAAGEDGILWNNYGSNAITCYSLSSDVLWSSEIPHTNVETHVVVQIGYTGEGYFVVVQAKDSGHQYLYYLDIWGKWVN